MFAKLFTLFPFVGSQDSEGAILAFIEETRDIPAIWISHALKSLSNEPGRKFAPSVGEIRGSALSLIRAQRRRSEGKPEKMLGAGGVDPLHEGRELAWARAAVALLPEGVHR